MRFPFRCHTGGVFVARGDPESALPASSTFKSLSRSSFNSFSFWSPWRFCRRYGVPLYLRSYQTAPCLYPSFCGIAVIRSPHDAWLAPSRSAWFPALLFANALVPIIPRCLKVCPLRPRSSLLVLEFAFLDKSCGRDIVRPVAGVMSRHFVSPRISVSGFG